MAKKKTPARLESWYRLKQSGGKGKHFREWDLQLDLSYGGMSFEDLRAEMDRIESEYGSEFSKFKIETDLESEPYSYDDSKYVKTYVLGWRSETDAEYEERINKAAKLEADREAREREMFERLAKKFATKD